uniref:Secreted protein n=1 Tax=Knipowitschia caucasica TaxID=637954 RepID=A0AAV2L6Q3_KNICA
MWKKATFAVSVVLHYYPPPNRDQMLLFHLLPVNKTNAPLLLIGRFVGQSIWRSLKLAVCLSIATPFSLSHDKCRQHMFENRGLFGRKVKC